MKPGEPGSTTTTSAITPNRDGLAAERDRLADLLVVRAALADTSDPELLAIDIVEDLIRSASDDVDEWGHAPPGTRTTPPQPSPVPPQPLPVTSPGSVIDDAVSVAAGYLDADTFDFLAESIARYAEGHGPNLAVRRLSDTLLALTSERTVLVSFDFYAPEQATPALRETARTDGSGHVGHSTNGSPSTTSMSSLHSFSRVIVPFRRGVNIGGVGAVMVCSSRAGVCSVPRPCALHRASWTVPVGTAAGCTPPRMRAAVLPVGHV